MVLQDLLVLSAPRVQLDPLDPLVHKETMVLMDLQVKNLAPGIVAHLTHYY